MTRSVLRRLASLTLLALSTLAVPAYAVFERHGPVNPAYGYPQWYQDKTGLTLEFCTPNAEELAVGHCLLLPGDTTAPEAFPAPFADEHFYWAGGAGGDWTLPSFAGARAEIVLGLEAAFGGGPVLAGDQVVFGRLRLRLDGDKVTGGLPLTGDYTFYTPYGKYVIHGIAGDPASGGSGRIFFTEDIGFQCPPGQFDCALQASIGPFLLPSAFPGGPEQAAFVDPAIPGNMYIADPARLGPVTGSVLPPWQTSDGPRNANIFRVEGPGGVLLFETTDFSLMGRIYQGPIVSRVAPKRASYTRDAGGTVEVDAYVVGEPTMQQRYPTDPVQPPVPPALRFYNAPCAGTAPPYTAPAGETPITLIPNGTQFWNMGQPAAVPAGVCYHDVGPNQFIQGVLGDLVVVSAAVFDPSNGGSLSVRAASSDAFLPPGLSVGAFGTLTTPVPLVNGLAYITPVAAPPESVRVFSMGLGQAELKVTRGVRAATGVTLTADLPSPQLPNSAIIFAAQGQGASNYLYRFRVNGTTVQDWSPTSTWTMVDLPEGDYSVIADVWLGLTPNAPDASSAPIAMQLRVPAATGVTLSASRPNPAPFGAAVTFTAAGQGSAGYDYRFSLSSNGGTSYSVVQGYGNGATWAMPTTTPVGNYIVRVDTRTSNLVDADATATMAYSVIPISVTITPNVPSPAFQGTAVTFTAASPNPAGYEYLFNLWLGNTKVAAGTWSADPTYVMPASQPAGRYTVQVLVRTSPTVTTYDAFANLAYTVIIPPATSVTLTPSTPSPVLQGNVVTFTAAGQGSTAPYEYLFNLWQGNTKLIAGSWSATPTFSLPANQPTGRYVVQVLVRTSSLVSFDAVANLTYEVILPPATGLLVTPSVPSPAVQGAAVVFTAEGQGSSGYQYLFNLFQGGTRIVSGAWSANPTYTLPTDLAPGTYLVQALVRTTTLVSFDVVTSTSYVIVAP